MFGSKSLTIYAGLALLLVAVLLTAYLTLNRYFGPRSTAIDVVFSSHIDINGPTDNSWHPLPLKVMPNGTVVYAVGRPVVDERKLVGLFQYCLNHSSKPINLSLIPSDHSQAALVEAYHLANDLVARLQHDSRISIRNNRITILYNTKDGQLD